MDLKQGPPLCVSEAKVVLVAQPSEGFSVLFGKLPIREIVPYVLSVLWF